MAPTPRADPDPLERREGGLEQELKGSARARMPACTRRGALIVAEDAAIAT
jgi:hypothetical protein